MIYTKLIRPLLFRMNEERAHNLAKEAGRIAQNIPMFSCLLRMFYRVEEECLRTNVLGINFENPVGLAAGFDKNAELVDLFYSLGFGFAEVGSVTAKSSVGNPLPRMFRLVEDEAIINRMGLNNEGADYVAEMLRYWQEKGIKYPLGVNITKTNDPEISGDAAIADFLYTFEKVNAFPDYVTLNISCPNTREGKTFEDPGALEELLNEIRLIKKDKPVLVKFSPDTDYKNLDKIVKVCMDNGIKGFVATNTTKSREGLLTPIGVLESIGAGGLSGPPLYPKALKMVRRLYETTSGRVPIIGVGGISSARDAYDMIRAGASLVQILTGFVYQGPCLVRRINKGLAEFLRNDEYPGISCVVGQACQ